MRQGEGPGGNPGWNGAPRRPDRTRVLGGQSYPTGPTEAIGPAADRPLAGRYRLTGRLPGSTSARSHSAIDTRLNRSVTATLLPHVSGADQRSWFEQQAQVLANLNHPGIAAVYDFGLDGSTPFVVTEPAEGPRLHEVLETRQLPPPEVARIGTDVADVLSYLHDAGVVHGNLNPANLVLDPSGITRLTDIGVGSLLYAIGQGPADQPPDDVYALGRVLREALTGDPEGPLPPGLDESFRRALHGMDNPDPERRPTARQVEAMLSRVGSGPAARPDDLPDADEDRRPSRPSTTTLVIVVGLLVLLAVVVGALLMNWNNAPEAPGSATTTTTQDRGDNEDRPSPTRAPETPQLPNIPTQLPDLPTNLPSLPSDLPDIPTELPKPPEVPDSVRDDARTAWDNFIDWVNRTFG